MAIFAYAGLPGAGKTYEVVRGPIQQALADGRNVWTNVQVTLPGVVVIEGERAKGHWYLEAPPGTVVVIDECWRYWGAGLAAADIPENIREWFAMHRHRTEDGRSTDVILICQDLSQVARFMRELVERTYRAIKLSALGTRTRYRVEVYEGSVTGQRPPADRKIGQWMGKYDPKVYALYKSHTQGGAAEEVSPDARGSVWRSPVVWAIPAAVILVPVTIMQLDFTPDAKVPPRQQAPVSARASVASPRATPVPAPTPPPPAVAADPKAEEQESGRWTLIGVIQKGDGSGLALVETTLGNRWLPLADCAKPGPEWRCVIDGQVVAGWTGGTWRTLGRVDPVR